MLFLNKQVLFRHLAAIDLYTGFVEKNHDHRVVNAMYSLLCRFCLLATLFTRNFRAYFSLDSEATSSLDRRLLLTTTV